MMDISSATEKSDLPQTEDQGKHSLVHLEHGQPAPGGHEVEFTGRQFGTVQGFDATGRHILLPQPSDSPDDPLNWSPLYKKYLAMLSCLAVFVCNITGAGPSIGIIEQCIEWFGLTGINSHNITKTAYLFTLCALMNGVGLFFWVPFATKFGRRPTYLLAFIIYFACILWCAFAKSYGSELAARIVLGMASGAGESLGALTVTDLFFVHERGTYMAFYNVLLSCGAAAGLIMDGGIVQHLTWRHIYYIDAAIVGAVLILVTFTFPETSFKRSEYIMNGHVGAHTGSDLERPTAPVRQKKTLLQRLSPWSGTFTEESYLRMFLRPWGVIFLPAVFLSMICFTATIAFLVAVTSNVASAFEELGFTAQSSGFLFFGAIVGSLIGIPAGGWLGDRMADLGAKKNNGIREPEHRLPAMIIPVITGPLSLVLYGVCIQKKTHWFVGCLGISLVNFNVCAATNIALVYAIDCYKPIADEVVTATLTFKAIFGFVIAFYTNTWVVDQGYLNTFGEMAGIEAGLLLFTVPIYFYGKRLRYSSARWRFIQWAIRWDDDRDDLKID